MIESQLVANIGIQITDIPVFPLHEAVIQQTLDDVLRIACRLLQVPVAGVVFPDDSQRWLQIQAGASTSLPIPGFRFHTDRPGLWVVQDTSEDPYFREYPFAIAGQVVRFFACIPLISSLEVSLGTLYLLDIVPHPSLQPEEDTQDLRSLAQLAAHYLELWLNLMGASCSYPAADSPSQELEPFFKLSLDLVCLIGFDGYFKRLNLSWESLLCYSLPEFLSRPLIDFVHPDDRLFTQGQFQKLSQSSQPICFEHRFRTREGSYRWLLWNAIPLGEQPLIYASVRDITPAKQADERLRLLESVVVNSKDALLILVAEELQDPLASEIIYSNQAFSDMTGYGPQEVLGQPFSVLQNNGLNRGEWDKVRQAMKTWQSVTVELQHHCRDDSAYWVELNAMPIADHHGWYTHWVVVQRDISDRKRAEQEVQAYAKAAAIIAQLGQQALRGTPLDPLMQETVSLIQESLGVDYCQVLELLPGRSAFLVRAGVGWQPGIVGLAHIAANERSQAGYTLQVGQPVIVEDLRVETRFSGTPMLHNHRVVSGVSVLICVGHRLAGGKTQGNDCYGVLSVHTTSRRTFTEDDVHFLQSVANVLASAIERSTAEEALRESEERYALAVQGSNEGLWDWKIDSNTIYFSPRWKEMLGCQEDEIGDSPEEWFNRIHPDDQYRVRAALDAHLEGLTAHFEKEYRMLYQDGSYRWVICRGMAVRNSRGKAYRMAGSHTDITARKVAEEQLIYDAFHDPLTRLPNRALFMDRLGQAMTRARHSKELRFAVLFLDLDRFKVINDSLGHGVGDQLLMAIARRLESCLNSRDTLARLGGDEFVILLEGIDDLQAATMVAECIQRQLRLPFLLDGQEVFITASIGITLNHLNPQQGIYWPGDLLRDADIALYRAKAQGKARYEVFDAAMHDHAVARLKLESDLRRALQKSSMICTDPLASPHFLLNYQPIVSLATGKITGFEALLRLWHPQRGYVSPLDFIPVAEETGTIVPIGAWVLKEACQQMKQWQDQFPDLPPLVMNVNISSRQFRETDLTHQIEEVLKNTGLPPQQLRLEITESVVMENSESAAAMLQELRSHKIQLSIDDFGTGYSSLSYLHRFPTNSLKIDRSFIRMMGGNGENSEIVRTIIALAHNLGMNVTAEGVETADQLALLRSLGCEHGQGYFFARPLSSHDATQLIANDPQW